MTVLRPPRTVSSLMSSVLRDRELLRSAMDPPSSPGAGLPTGMLPGRMASRPDSGTTRGRIAGQCREGLLVGNIDHLFMH